MHIANGVDVDHQRHKADDHHHQRTQTVDQETNFHPDAVSHQPGIDTDVLGRVRKQNNSQVSVDHT
jgi:hypothetical protein